MDYTPPVSLPPTPPQSSGEYLDLKIEKLSRLYLGVDKIRQKYGKHTLYLGSSFAANNFAQHLGERGDVPERKQKLLPGETARKRLAIPMFLGEVN